MDDELITVTVDRPIGSSHPDYPSLVYPVNYGYIEGVLTPGGEEQDAYIIGVDIPVDKFTGRKIAIIHRKDDVGDKWVVAPENMPYTKQQIEEMVYFQEQYYDSFVQMLNEEMSMRQSLNGLWYFSYAKNLAYRIEGFEKADYNCKK